MSEYDISKSNFGYTLIKEVVAIDDTSMKSTIFARPYPEAPIEFGFAHNGDTKTGVF